MAINRYKNDTSQEEFRGQRLTQADLDLFGRGLQHIQFDEANPNFVFVTKLYDESNNLLDFKISQSLPDKDPMGNFILDPTNDIKNFGFGTGTFRLEYNFWEYKVGTDTDPGIYVSEISPSKTEVRILPNKNGNEQRDTNLEIDFRRFSNLVLSENEATDIVNDFFDEITSDGMNEVVITTISDHFINRLMAQSAISDIEGLHATIGNVIDQAILNSKPIMIERIKEDGFVSFVNLLRVYDTVLREQIFNVVTGYNHLFNLI